MCESVTLVSAHVARIIARHNKGFLTLWLHLYINGIVFKKPMHDAICMVLGIKICACLAAVKGCRSLVCLKICMLVQQVEPSCRAASTRPHS